MADADGDRRRGLDFGILGPLRVMHAGVPLALGGPQQRAVLALLLINAEQVVPIARIADELWGERPPAGFTTTIQTYIFHLRAAIEPTRPRGAPSAVLVTEAGGYRLYPDGGTVDATAFEQRVRSGRDRLAALDYDHAATELQQALGLWRGSVLSDLGDYEFVRSAAARLDELRLGAIESRIEAELALGRHSSLVAELDQLVTDHPLRERLQAQRMLALYRSDRQSDALASYRSISALLRDELGVEPGPELQRIHQAVLKHDPKLATQPFDTAHATELGSASLDDKASVAPPVPRRRVRRRWIVGGALAAATVITSATVFVVSHARPSSLRSLAANSIAAIEPNGRLHSLVTTGPNPDGIVYGAGALWIANTGDGTVSRVDPVKHRIVQTIKVGSAPESIAVWGKDVWVANSGDGTVSRINVDINEVAQQISVGNLPIAIAAGSSGVWVANSGDGTVDRIDPGSGDVTRRIPVGGSPDGIAVDDHTVWVANGRDGSASPIDATSGIVASSIPVGAGPKGLAITADSVWVANQFDLTVSRIDITSRRVVATIQVGDGPNSIVAAGRAVWVGDEFDGAITRIDPVRNEADRRVALGASPRGLAVVGKSVWVVSGAFTDPSHKGGTLRVATNLMPGFDSVDPANAYTNITSGAESQVYDGLVGLHRIGGANGYTLVPDLATTLPRPTDGGLTYVFTLRRGIRYSTGVEVKPADFRRGVQQALTEIGGNPDLYAGIIGGRACITQPKKCNLASGITTDDATNQVVFHLQNPDPDFLYKLTEIIYPTPQATPGVAATKPIPGTGPYLISMYVKGKQFILTRNPNFRRWSFAAQPDGYPDVITWHTVSNARAALSDILSGTADLVAPSLNLTQDVMSDVLHRYPTLFRSDFQANTQYEFLNTRIAPFKDARVRQAISYAADRNQILTLIGGQPRATVTCQVLPPDFPGYQPYCPYTLGGAQAGGGYQGPDRVEAQRLIAASGTRGMTVKIATFAGDPDDRQGKYFAALLASLGYHPILHEVVNYFDYIGDPKNGVQMGDAGWGADYPAASIFFGPNFACSTGIGYNQSQYCNPKADALAARALAVQGSDPAAATRLWADVDRFITDDAPWVATVNLKRTLLVSTRVQGFVDNPELGPLFDQMWVR
jgi:YVTN family beta-propeller protein